MTMKTVSISLLLVLTFISAGFSQSKVKRIDDLVKTYHEYGLFTGTILVSENGIPNIDSNHVVLEKKIDGCQMVLDHFIDLEITENIVLLTQKNIDEVYDLIWLVMPGFYQKRGFEMGNFFGIFKDDKLVAISGQRMQTDDFIEVSSVVTHPDYTKRGFARQLITHTTKEILKQNKLPILHTNKGNKAIPLYEKLGYKLSRNMNWLLFSKK